MVHEEPTQVPQPFHASSASQPWGKYVEECSPHVPLSGRTSRSENPVMIVKKEKPSEEPVRRAVVMCLAPGAVPNLAQIAEFKSNPLLPEKREIIRRTDNNPLFDYAKHSKSRLPDPAELASKALSEKLRNLAIKEEMTRRARRPGHAVARMSARQQKPYTSRIHQQNASYAQDGEKNNKVL